MTNTSNPALNSSNNTLYAYSRKEYYNLADVARSFAPAQFQRLNNDTLFIPLNNDTESMFVFEYGSVVFINISVTKREELLERLGSPSARTIKRSTDENFYEDDYRLKISDSQLGVSFNSVTIPHWDIPIVCLICTSLAQSCALELIEDEVNATLVKSEQQAQRMSKKRRFSFRRSYLLQQASELLETRHRIINELAVLDKPEITWENEFAEKLYRELSDNFEFNQRLALVEKDLQLIADTIDLQVEILNTRRSEVLELIIIILIVIEILQTALSSAG
jgi:uncharacterized Rmd1/YagE family protein